MRNSASRIDKRAGWRLAAAVALVVQFAPHGAMAKPAAFAPSADAGSDDGDALPYVECVPFARQASGIQLFGDAHTWWDQADGQYTRGHVPSPGAVMSFRPHGAMRLGHVAMVSRVIDTRTVLLRHSNWSPIGGRRGQAELDVRAVDVSDANDWSEVRVWYAPIGDLGTTRWPVNGFIYKHGARPPLLSARTTLAQADAPRVTRLVAMRPAAAAARPTSLIDNDFLDGIQPETGATAPRIVKAVAHAPVRMAAIAPARTYLMARTAPAPVVLARNSDDEDAVPVSAAPALRDDPIGRIIAARMTRSAR
ncbi:CHAP domain-containing protein [Novosphingobium sp.]|uniref:CHAP domain-containing protein n=1 Tax=Novosphingobium sp. TaxID=1874826 RepID=UPI003D139D48